MTENPDTWGELEWLINDALVPEQGSVAGLSTQRRIADAIRERYPTVGASNDHQLRLALLRWVQQYTIKTREGDRLVSDNEGVEELLDAVRSAERET